MISNRKVLNRIIVIISIPVFGFCQAQSHPNQLNLDRSYWERAVGISEKNKCRLPGKITTMETVFDDQGKQVEETGSVLQLSKSPKPELTLVSYTVNGKDNTDSAVKAFEAHKQEVWAFLELSRLFRIAHKIGLTALKIEGVTAIYTVNLVEKDLEFKGQIQIDIPSGVAFYSQFTCPQMEGEDYLISDYKAAIYYAQKPEAWYAEKSIATMGIKSKSRFLSFTGRVREETRLTHHFCTGH